MRKIICTQLWRAVFSVACAAGLAATLQAQALAASAPALVAAAANLQPALAELVPLFEREYAGRVSVTLGSSANLVRQIQQGLPAELFLSADEDFALRLADAGLTLDRGAVYATGRIVVLVPAGSPVALDPRLDGLKAALPRIRKFAIANPELAPYGRAAVQALQKLELWSAIEPKLVLGENIAQATQFVATGAAQAGITALSLVLVPGMDAQVRYLLISAELHAPLRQRMVLLKNAGPAARAFYRFLRSPAAKAVLARHGYA